MRAATLLAADPHGCGGVVVRAGAGPVRDAWLAHLRGLIGDRPWRRMPAGIADDRLLGGLDLAATLRSGRPVAQSGLLAEADGGLIVVPMAERLPPGTVARLCAALDTGAVRLEREGLAEARPARFGLVLLDEGGEDETVAEALADRLAFRIDLDGVGWREIDEHQTRHGRASPGHPRHDEKPMPHGGAWMPGTRPGMTEANLDAHLSCTGERAPVGQQDRTSSQVEDDVVATLCAVAEDLGIVSLRAPLLAVRVARLAARGEGRAVAEPDLIAAARLVLAPRATRLPPSEPSQPEEAEPAPEPDDTPAPQSGEDEAAPADRMPDEIVVEAARAAIPPNLLAQLLAGGPRRQAGRAGRMGASAKAPRTGRPVGNRPGDPRRGRLDLIATLRAAAPWQRLRRKTAPSNLSPHPEAPERSGGLEGGFQIPLRPLEGSFEAAEAAPQDEGVGRGERARPEVDFSTLSRRLVILPDDLRIKRLVQRAETTTIFCVDASGSAALERLAEAKGAVELLLAESYVRRDRVALVAFQGTGAALLLPPTRSLVRAKRALASLPGGGGTPLAAGLDMVTQLALAVRRAGGSPVVVLLTDGRANVTRAGTGGRVLAGEEALAAARALRAADLRLLVIDTGARPEGARAIAEAATGRYCPLPHADARQLSAAVKAAG